MAGSMEMLNSEKVYERDEDNENLAEVTRKMAELAAERKEKWKHMFEVCVLFFLVILL